MQKVKKDLNKKVKKLDVHDIQLTKLAVAASVLFILNIWPSAMNWVASIHWAWFLVAAIIFAIRPMKRFWCKK